MTESYELWKKPEAKETYLVAGWRQWADAGSVSSGLPQYLINLLGADPIGDIHPDGFYLFQVPGTHDLVRPVVRFEDGYPKSLDVPHNEFYYTGNGQHGLVIFLGDEPHLDVERYVAAFLSAAQDLKVKRIIGLGGVYGELPYDKERLVSAIYSLRKMKQEMGKLAVNLSDYQGGASIGSYTCKRAGDRKMEYMGLYSFVPSYNFSQASLVGRGMQLENDYTAWLGVLRRIDFMFKLNLDLSDLEKKSQHLLEVMDAKVDEIEREAPQLGLRDRLKEISAEFKEMPFLPLDDVWEDELRHLMEKFDKDLPKE
jgi:proteasome assembly chaperone (PAC2) family protein